MLTLPSQVHTALDRLTAAGWEAYVVGGAVRDALRGCAERRLWLCVGTYYMLRRDVILWNSITIIPPFARY